MSVSPITQSRLMRTYQVTLSTADGEAVSFPVNLSYEVDGDNNAIENGSPVRVNSLAAHLAAVKRLRRLATKANDEAQLTLISNATSTVRCTKQRFVQVRIDATTGRPIAQAAR